MTALAASNPRIRRLRRLSGRRSARHDEGAFLLEGPTLVGEAIATRTPLEAVFVEEGCDLELAARAAEAGNEVLEVAPGVLGSVIDVVTPRPVVAVAPLVPASSQELLLAARASRRPLLVLVEVADPGNLGTILRAAEASGCVGVACSHGTVDPWSPKATRSSAGAILRVPVAPAVDVATLLAAALGLEVPTLATVVGSGRDLYEAPLDAGAVILLGGEAHGLAPELVDAVDLPVTIPMDGPTESLNVAMAASIVAFEALRQRRFGRPSDRGGGDGARLVDPAAQPIGRPEPPASQ